MTKTKWLNADTITLLVPITFAVSGFILMTVKTLTLDPDMSRNVNWYEKQEADNSGKRYNMFLKQYFNDKSTSIFPNKV